MPEFGLGSGDRLLVFGGSEAIGRLRELLAGEGSKLGALGTE